MKNLILVALVGLLHFSCAPSTPQARIEENPVAFSRLSHKHQDLVRQGRITDGMTPQAVEFAWGPPAERFQGTRNSKASERWDYIGTRAVYSNQFFGGFGFGGYGGNRHYGRRGYSDFGYLGLGPEINYLPYRVGSVWFVRDRVDSWERVR